MGVFLVVLAGIYLLLPQEFFHKSDNILEYHFVKGDPELTVIGGETGITGVYFTIKIVNTKDIPLDVSFDIVEPLTFKNALDITPFTLDGGEQMTIKSDIMDSVQFEVGKKTFSVSVSEDFTCPLGSRCTDTDSGEVYEPGESGVRYEYGEVELDFQPEEVEIGSDVEFIGSTDTGSEGGVEEDPEDETTTTTTSQSTTTTTETYEGETKHWCWEECMQYDIHGICQNYDTICVDAVYLGEYCSFTCPSSVEGYGNTDFCLVDNYNQFDILMTTDRTEIGTVSNINCGASYYLKAYLAME